MIGKNRAEGFKHPKIVGESRWCDVALTWVDEDRPEIAFLVLGLKDSGPVAALGLNAMECLEMADQFVEAAGKMRRAARKRR